MARTALLSTATLCLGLLVGGIWGGHAPLLAATPCATQTPPLPVKGKHLLAVSGTTHKQTSTFVARRPYLLSWNAQVTHPLQGPAEFRIEVDDARTNSPLNVVAEGVDPTRDISTEYEDCAHGCYLRITAINMTYAINVIQ